MEHAKYNDISRNKDLRKEWQRHIEAWRTSGETQVSYCQKRGLSRHAFQYWKHILEKSKTNGFVELSRAAPPGSDGVVEIIVNNPIQIRVPQGVSSEHLHMVLQAVKEL
jgi:hypothetical protein